MNKANEEAAKYRREAERLAEALRRSEAEVAATAAQLASERAERAEADYRCGQLEEALGKASEREERLRAKASEREERLKAAERARDEALYQVSEAQETIAADAEVVRLNEIVQAHEVRNLSIDCSLSLTGSGRRLDKSFQARAVRRRAVLAQLEMQPTMPRAQLDAWLHLDPHARPHALLTTRCAFRRPSPTTRRPSMSSRCTISASPTSPPSRENSAGERRPPRRSCRRSHLP